ncbi:MAG: hypothetical protein KC910_25810 [Candidatus Eremiobacteraeota bacterium]|nr:hypothetical protein [Candidatus Eremiobacteraeota bacterium]
MIKTLTPGYTPNLRRAAPPGAGSDEPKGHATDSYKPSEPLTVEASWAGGGEAAKLSGGQMALLGFAVLASAAGAVGAVVSNLPSSPPPTSQSQPVEQAAPTESPVPVAKPGFFDNRELLVDLSSRATNPEFLPDPSFAVEERGSLLVFEESYIAPLVDRDLTAAQLPEGAPRFTSAGADTSQMSKVYIDAQMREAQFGDMALKHGAHLTRPTRMNGRGSGISDQIGQHHLSCIYRLESDAVVGGVQLKGGQLYRVTVMDPHSRAVTRPMDRAVCPSNRLLATAMDVSVLQSNEQGDTLYVNPADILQVWTLTPGEAARYGG